MRAPRLVLILAVVLVGTLVGLTAGLWAVFYAPAEPLKLEDARPANWTGVVWRV